VTVHSRGCFCVAVNFQWERGLLEYQPEGSAFDGRAYFLFTVAGTLLTQMAGTACAFRWLRGRFPTLLEFEAQRDGNQMGKSTSSPEQP
jgi:hypothetical protein